MESNYLKQLKALISDVYDIESDKILYTSKGRYIQLLKDKDKLNLVRLFADLVINTDFVRLPTRLSLMDPYSNCGRVKDTLKKKYSIDMSSNQIYQIWYQDKIKLTGVIGNDFFNVLMGYSGKEEIEVESELLKYKESLQSILDSRDGTSLYDRCMLNLETEEYAYSITDEQFEQFIKIIRPYIRLNFGKAQQSLNNEVLGYIKFICTRNTLSEIDSKRLQKLRKILENG